MSNTNNGGPAFPVSLHGWGDNWASGMTLRQYAAIKLRVPQSGDVWLDVMIEDSLRNDLAAKAMQMMRDDLNAEWIAERAYEMADAMLRARDGGAA